MTEMDDEKACLALFAEGDRPLSHLCQQLSRLNAKLWRLAIVGKTAAKKWLTRQPGVAVVSASLRVRGTLLAEKTLADHLTANTAKTRLKTQRRQACHWLKGRAPHGSVGWTIALFERPFGAMLPASWHSDSLRRCC